MTDQPGVPDLAHAMIALRKDFAADELRATYWLGGHEMTITVTAEACVIETEGGRIRIPVGEVE